MKKSRKKNEFEEIGETCYKFSMGLLSLFANIVKLVGGFFIGVLNWINSKLGRKKEKVDLVKVLEKEYRDKGELF